MSVLIIPCDRGSSLVEAKNIIRVEGMSNYSKIYFVNRHPMTVAKVLRWFQDNLPQQMFTRVHRSHLVNRLFMLEINGAKSSTLLLKNGESIAMSRRKKLLRLSE
ncbi:MAG: LytTR family DNA-binding domain-containing protein [Ferruginibacter sp.]